MDSESEKESEVFKATNSVCTTTQPQESRKPHQVSLGPQPQASRKPHQVSLGPQPQASPKSSSSTSSSDQAQNILSGRDVVILRTLKDIKQGQREMMAMISGLVKRLDGCGEKNKDVPDGVYLPISTEEQLNHTEEILNEPGSMKMM
ncbi:uncharacterized protein LOC132747612, partial [Ruditapes philippinarum]|uniref:uncharacterized protein LOC132747612 n=1 Tax=Ruditapes philippinarum TaxID=129788 RepID=UPI00295BB74C